MVTVYSGIWYSQPTIEERLWWVMYPNSICAFNIFAETMIGKLFVEGGDDLKNYDEDAGKEFIEDIITENHLFTGNKWFKLPNFDSLNEIITKELHLNPVGLPESGMLTLTGK